MLIPKLKILWLSDTPHRPSGFGIVSGEICRRLSALGYEITMLGWWSKKALDSYAGITVMRCSEHPMDATRELVKYINHLAPHFLIALGDVPWLSYLATTPLMESIAKAGTQLCLYFPVDGVLPDGRIPSEWTRILKTVDIPITMSRFGLSAVTHSGVDAAYIPHGCNIQLFCPPTCKETAKQKLGYQDKFVILSDVRNHRRKLLPRLLDIAHLLRIPESKFVLHLHTNLRPEEDQDVYTYDLRRDVAQLGLSSVIRLTDVRRSNGFLPKTRLAELYAAADVHLLTSYGEGFGLATLQAASCGVVPIACSHSANIELLGQHGIAIPPDSSTLDEFGLVRGFIDTKKAATAVHKLFDDRTLLCTMSRSARQFAIGYSWDTVVAKWDQLLRTTNSKSRCVRPYALVGNADKQDIPETRTGTIRPSGHLVATLPMPRLGLPVRLRSNQSNIVVVASKFAKHLLALEKLFPGLAVLSCDPIEVPSLIRIVRHSLLVVDPDRSLHPSSDFVCALLGTPFLGSSSYWPEVVRRGLILQARALLTDMPLAENRACAAKQRAKSAIASGQQQSIDSMEDSMLRTTCC